MFIPIGDTPNPKGIPWLTYILIGLNVVVFLFVSLPLNSTPPALDDPLLPQYLNVFVGEGRVSLRSVLANLTAYDLFVFRNGFRPASPSVQTLFSSMFLHAGWMHLAGNMLFLWIFGDNVEYRLGRIPFLLAYLTTGAAATFFFSLFVPHSQVPLVGASGAISGLLGFYYLWFPRNKVKTFIFLFPFIMGTYLIPARFVLGFYLLVDNLIPFLINGGRGTGVAHGAHIGGFLVGMGLAWGFDLMHLSAARYGTSGKWWFGRRTSGSKEDVSYDPVRRVGLLLSRGDLVGAAEAYFGLRGKGERRLVTSTEIIRLADGLLVAGEVDRALAVFRRFIAERPSDPLIDRAFLGAGKSMLHMPRQITSAYQYFLAALDVTERPEIAEEARRHLRTIERTEGDNRGV